MELEIVFFDLTIPCDSAKAAKEATEETLRYLSSQFPELKFDEARSLYDEIRREEKPGIPQFSRNDLRTGTEARRQRFEKLCQAVEIPLSFSMDLAEFYRKSKHSHLRAFPEVIPVLRRLSESFALGIIINGFSDIQRDSLHAVALEPYFGYVLIAQEVCAWKPDRKIFLEAIRQASAEPSKALMIGDSIRQDIATPKVLGMHTGLVARTAQAEMEEKMRPDLIMHHLGVLPRLVKS